MNAKNTTVKPWGITGIPDLWHLANSLSPESREQVLMCWHQAHDFRREREDLLAALKAVDHHCNRDNRYAGGYIISSSDAKLVRQAIARAEGGRNG